MPKRLLAMASGVRITRPMIGPAIHQGSVDSSVARMRFLSFLVDGRSQVEARSLGPGGRGNREATCGGQRRDDENRRPGRCGIGAETGDECADDEAEVAPEAINADGASAFAWADGV